MKNVSLIIGLFMLNVAATVTFAYAPEGKQWAQRDDKTREWFNGLKNGVGFPCCDYAEGSRVDDPDWQCEDDHNGPCKVKLDDAWVDVPPNGIVTANNMVGYAVVWRAYDNGKPFIRCFLPGSRV